MIVNLRGTSGSGKTSAVKQLLEMYDSEEVKEGKKVVAHMLDTSFGSLIVIGKYTNVCGGCDTLPIPKSRELIKKYGKKVHVLFEGLVMNNGYAINRDIMRSMNVFYAFAFLDTPLRTCISRIRKRRKAAGNTKELDVTNTVKMYYSNLKMLERCVRDDAHPVIIDHTMAVHELQNMYLEEMRYG